MPSALILKRRPSYSNGSSSVKLSAVSISDITINDETAATTMIVNNIALKAEDIDISITPLGRAGFKRVWRRPFGLRITH